jgi:pyruvate dehydrogenase E2 component (dihydrolipoamide acetyltransferase)
MNKQILMPALTAGMEEGKLARWLKKPGDPVSAGEIIAEIESDKAMMEMPAEFAGVLQSILVDADEIVAVNQPIAVLLVQEESGATPHRDPGVGAAPRPGDEQVTLAVPTIPQAQEDPNRAADGERIAASPLARRRAGELGISLSGLKGSGPNGRVVSVDIERVQSSDSARPRSGEEAPYREVPHSLTRKTIARRLAEAKATIPHFYLQVDCEIDGLLALRARVNQADTAAKLSINDFVVKAAALAIRAVPETNACWTEDAIRLFDAIDVAVAVSTDNGLITPIVRSADVKSVRDISIEVRALSKRAREQRLQPVEYQGGGFTISNLGMHGVQSFSAIINPPQSCILAVGAAVQRPVIRDNACVAATLMSCTLSVDHRSVDGVVGARYLEAFKAVIERPDRLMAQ